MIYCHQNQENRFLKGEGAGRIMSRMEARRTLDLETYRRAMEGIYTTSVNEHTLDEAPMVYKSLSEIPSPQRFSVLRRYLP